MPQNTFYLHILQSGGLKLPFLVYEWGYPKHKYWWSCYRISPRWFRDKSFDLLCPVIHRAPTTPTFWKDNNSWTAFTVRDHIQMVAFVHDVHISQTLQTTRANICWWCLIFFRVSSVMKARALVWAVSVWTLCLVSYTLYIYSTSYVVLVKVWPQAV